MSIVWPARDGSVFNTYGPTEATVSATLARLQPGQPVTIGEPLPNYGLLVVDSELRPVPAGENGEICIFGPGVAVGYLGQPELTAQRFVANPLASGCCTTRGCIAPAIWDGSTRQANCTTWAGPTTR